MKNRLPAHPQRFVINPLPCFVSLFFGLGRYSSQKNQLYDTGLTTRGYATPMFEIERCFLILRIAIRRLALIDKISGGPLCKHI